MRNTFCDLSLSIREKAAPLLQQSVANGLDLYSQIKQAHWTIKGPAFLLIHEFFDDLGSQVLEFVDVLAERLEQIGGTVQGTIRVAARSSTLEEYPLENVDEQDHIKSICKVLRVFNHQCRENIQIFSDMKDDVTSELYTDIALALDKKMWMLESHLKTEDIPG